MGGGEGLPSGVEVPEKVVKQVKLVNLQVSTTVLQVVADVYYEALCPDSRYFVMHELLPTYSKYGRPRQSPPKFAVSGQISN